MFAGEMREAVEKTEPDQYEEEEYYQNDCPDWRIVATKEVAPIAAIGGGEPIVLENHHYKEPLRSLSLSLERLGEVRDLLRRSFGVTQPCRRKVYFQVSGCKTREVREK